MTDAPAADPDDAARWWQAYCLAEHDETDELRRRADRGDDHARRQLASWLAERGRAAEAVRVIRPLADAGDDIAQLWLARWLADCDQAGELRQRAGEGNDHARDELAGWLAAHGQLTELRELIGTEDGLASLLTFSRYWQADIDVLRLLADAGDGGSGRQLARWLARRGDIDELRQRAAAGDEHARQQLAGR